MPKEKKSLPLEIELLIVEDYNNDISIKNIMEKYETNQRMVYRTLENHHIPRKFKNVSEEQYVCAVKDYTNGMGMDELVDKHKISFVSICKYMKKNGIEYCSGKGRKYHFNQSYFEEINNPEKAYWFGYLYADASISMSNQTDKNPVRIRLNCSQTDRFLIEKFLDAIDSNTPIKDYIPIGTYAQNPMSHATINSVKICSDLLKNGFRLLKENVDDTPFRTLNDSYYRDFIRGYFDGDGHITVNGFGITTQEPLALKIQEVLMKECELNKTKFIIYEEKGNGSLVTLKYGGKKQLKRIFNYLYENSTVYLPRKYEKFLSEISD